MKFIKELSITFLSSLLFVFLFTTHSVGQIVNIPDANFKAALLNHSPTIDINNNGEIEISEARLTTALSVDSRNISSLVGIEEFLDLTYFTCSTNRLSTLNLSNNTALTILYCNFNNLSTLDVSNNINLRELHCGFNPLCNLSKLPSSLHFLYADGTSLTCLKNKPAGLTNVAPSSLLTNPVCQASQHQKNITVDGVLYDNVFTVTSNADFDQAIIDDNPDELDNTCLGFVGTLRWAINKSNSLPGKNRIQFMIPTGQSSEITFTGSMPDILGNTIIDGRNNSAEVVFKSGLDLRGDEIEINSITFRGVEYTNHINTNAKINRIINCKFYNNNNNNNSFAISTHHDNSITPNVRIFNCYFEKFTEALNIANGNFTLEKNTFKNNQTAIFCYGVSRPRGDISPTVSSFNNTFDENTSVGINDIVSTLLQSSQNIFTNTPDGAKAITSNKSAPVITSVSENNGIITIAGTASGSGEKIEIFANTSNQPEIAEKYIAVTTSVGTNWSITIPRAEWPITSDSWVTATAANNWKTSSLATSLKVPVALPIYVCPQFINVLKDNSICNGCVDANGQLVLSVVEQVTSLNVAGKGLTCLEGIEYFKNLNDLRCQENQLTFLDVSKNIALSNFYCWSNQLVDIDVTQNTQLLYFQCGNNKLNQLNLTKNLSLNVLWCYSNQFSNLDLSQNTMLARIDCRDNKLTTLDISKNIGLNYLYCANNQFKNLYVSQNNDLEYLNCSNNPLCNLSKLPSSLFYLYADGTLLTCLKNKPAGLTNVAPSSLLTNPVCQPTQHQKNITVDGVLYDNVFTVTSNADFDQAIIDANPDELDNTCLGFVGTLRWAINKSNSLPGKNRIQFMIPTGQSSEITFTGNKMPDILGNTIIDGRNNSEEVVFKSGYLILYGDEVEINSITFRGYFLSISANSKTNRIINCKFYKNIDGYTIAINTNNLISITPNVRIFNCYFEKFTEALSIANGNFILEKNTFKNNETAIYCYSIPRPIGTISPTVSSFNNTFDENTSVGISNTLNTLQSSQDIFTNTPDGAKAITSNKSAPVITSVSENNGIITITGTTSGSGEKIEIFANSSNKAQTAEKYVDFLITNSASWSFTIERSKWPFSTDSWVTAHASDNKQTSELAPSVKVPVALPIYVCPQFINVLKDNNICNGCVDANGILVESVVSKRTSLNVSNKNLTCLDGIENFTALTTLLCNDNQINELNIDQNTKLASLRCTRNNLKSLNLSSNTSLAFLTCDNNKLESLDLEYNIKLTSLNCSYNFLSELNVSKNTKLRSINCANNELFELNTSLNPLLESLNCSNNSLSNLNLINNTILFNLYISNNFFSELKLGLNTNLHSLICSNNPLLSILDLNQNEKLESLECNNCNLQTLDLRRNSILESVFAQGNKFYTLDVSQNNLLISLELKDNINLCNLSILPEQLEYLDVESTNVSCLRNIPSNLITTPELPICSNNPALEEGIDRNVIIDGISYDNVFKVTRNDDFDPKLVANNLDDLNVSCLNLKGTLRWAVMKANSEPDKVNRIEFAPPLGSATFQINLQHGNLDFRSKNITIDGSTVAGYDLAKNPKVVINFNHTGAIDCNYNLPVNGGRGMIYDFNQKFLMKGLGITNATWQKGGQQQGFFIQGFTVTKLEFSDCYFVNTIRNTNPSLSGNSLVARTTYSAPISFHNCTFGNNTEQNLTSVVGFNTLFENQYNMNQIYSGEPFNNFYKCKFLSFSSTPVVNSNNTDSPPYPNKVSQSIFIGNPKNIEYGTAAPQIIGVGLTGNLYGNSISNNTIIEIYKVGANGIDAIEFMGSTKSDLQLKEWSYAVANNLGNKPLVIGEKYIALEVFYNKSFEFSTPFIMIDGRCIVKNTNNAGEGSLRAAITCAVGKREPTDITFEISTNAPYVLKLETALPTFQNLRFPITLAAPLNVKSKTFSIIPNVATANFEPFVVGTNATVSNFIFKGFTNNAPVLVRNGGTLKNSKFEANKNSVIVDGNESRVGGVLSVNTIEDCNFLNGTSTDVFVNTVNSENEFKLNIRACSFGGGVNGIEVIGGKYFENLDILNCYFGYNIETSSTLPMKGLGINLISQLDYTQIKKINVVGCYFTSCLGGGFKSALSGDFNFDSNIFGVSAANKFGVNNFGILLSGQWSNYNITGNHFPNMTNAAVTIAGGAIASANGTIKNNYFGYDLNKNKLIANLPTTTVAIQLSNSTVDIKNNFINKYHKGIVINSSFSSDITFNDFSNTGNSGIEISGLFYGKVNNNRLENFNNFGINFLPTSNSSRNNIEIIGNTLSTSSRTRNIQLANLYYSKVNNNTVNGGGNGIILSNCSFNKFEVNTINDQLSNALILNGESSNNEITNLTVKSESPKNAVAVIINNLCSNNTLKSTIISNYNNGIQIIGEAINNIVSETTINPVTGFAINLSKPSTSTFTGNNNYKAPIVNKLRVQNQNILMTVTAQVNDVVEIFLSEKGTGNQEILRTFVTKINMENSTSKEFAINLADLNTKLNITNPDDKNTYYFRATATNTSGTSRVSNLKFICPNCECIVSNTQDELTAPTNSLREAITKANGGECSKIIFKIPSDELANGIVLKGLLPSIANSYTIDGTQQLGYSNTKYPLVVIKGVSTLSQGLNVLESNVTIKGIAFSGFSTGIILAKPQTELNAVTIGNTVNNYLTINTGANENKIIDCYFGKSIEENALGNTNTNLSNVIRDATTNAIGVVVNSNANIFTNCHIANTRLQNILIRNSCSKNRFNTGSLTNSGKSGLANRAGIVFENTSNVQNNITAPFILAHQVINNKMELTVQTKNTDDFIQVYQSINTPQNAVKFITPQTVVKKTNSNPLVNEWVVTLDNVSYDAAGTYFFVANATDKEDNTSPLSKLYKVNSDYEVCTITSLEELGSGSIREAVECANNAEGKAKIDFAFAEDDQEKTIKLLPTSINHLAITNAFGVMIQPKEKQKMVIGGNGSVKLIFSGNNAIAQNLKLNNIPTEINGGTNHSLSKLVFELSLLTLNKDASNSIIENNSFLDNARLIVNGAKQIRISRNTFNNPGAGTIKAITLSNGGNSSVVNGAKKVPAVRLINLNKGILKFAITSQTPEEKIELFLGTVQGQRALRFLKEYSTTTKSNVVIGELNLKDFTNNDPNINQIVITATGTDKEGNTSELSPNLLMTTCIVNNNQDVPSNPKLAGSLRANVTLVNDGGCQIVMFNIPNDAPEIRLGSVLPIISRSAILDATTLQQGYSEKDEKPVVKITSNSNTLPSGLRISAMVATNGLILDKFATAITIGGTGNNIQILNSSFQNAGIGVSILSGRKDITIDKCTWGDTLGFTSATSIQDLGSENLTVTNSKFFLGENSIAFLSSTNAASTSKNFKFNNNVFSGISNSITKNNSQGFQLTNAIIGNIEKNIFTNVGKPIIAEKSSGTINYNILRRSYQLEKIIRTEAEPKKEILYQHSAIQLNNCFNLKLDSNILTDYRINGIVINGASVTNTILSNRIYKVSNIGIWINNAPNQEVNGNVVDTLANVGILVEPNSPNTILAGNIIRGCKQYGIWVKSERNKIMSNYIGDAPKETLLGNNIGLYLQSNNNLIGNIEGANFFVRNKNGGIVNEGNKNRIIYNTFTYNDVSDRKPSPNVKAIRNVGNANESIQPPRDFSYKKIGEDYEISGKAGANEIIHFYRSNGFPQNTQLTSVKVEWKVINDKGVEEIREGFRQNILGLVKSNDDGTFTFKVIKDNLDPNNTTYIVTTATKLFSGDDAASTSELSKIFPIGPCIISNTEDIADSDANQFPVIGSLRAAIGCANEVLEPAKVITKIFEVPTVELKSDLLPITNKYGLTFSGKNLGFELLESKLHIKPAKDIALNHGLSLSLPNANWENKVSISEVIFSSLNTALLSTKGHLNIIQVEVNGDKTKNQSLLTISESKTDININELKANNLETIIKSIGVENNFDYCIIDNSKLSDVNSMIVPIGEFKASSFNNNQWVNPSTILKDLNFNSVNFENNTFSYNNSYNKPVAPLIECYSESRNSIKFISNTITAKDAPNLNGDAYLIYVYGSITSYNIFDKNTINIKNNNVGNKIGGIYIGGYYENSNNNVSDNTINLNGNAINLQCEYGSSINNKIFNNVINSNLEGIKLEGIYNSNIYNNTIVTNDNNAIKLSSCERIYMTNNLMSGNVGNTKAVELVNSNNRISQDYPVPIIDKVITEKIKEPKPYLELHGMANVGEKIELFFSQGPEPENTLPIRERKDYKPTEINQANTIKFIANNIIADATGKWTYRIPKDWNRNLTENLYITAQGTVDNANSSELSNIYTLKPFTETVIVKNTNNDGEFSLRAALETINSTDFYTKVVFNIQDNTGKPLEGPHVIKVEGNALNEFSNYTGFSIDGKSQKLFADPNDLNKSDVFSITILSSGVNGSQFPTGLMVGEGGGEKSHIKNLTIKNFENGIDLKTGQVKLESVVVKNENKNGGFGLKLGSVKKIETNTTDILFPEKDFEQMISKCLFYGYESSIDLDPNIEKIHISENKFDEVNFGISGSEKLSNSIFEKNIFLTVHRVAISLETKDENKGKYNTNQVIKNNWFGYDPTTTTYASSMSVALATSNMQESYIIDNFIPFIAPNQEIVALVDETMGNIESNVGLYFRGSKDNTISNNYLGTYLDITESNLDIKSHQESIGIKIIANEDNNDKILGNHFANIGTAIKLENVVNTIVANNTIGARKKKTTSTTPNETESTIDIDDVEQLDIFKQAIIVSGKSKNSSIVDNYIGNYNTDNNTDHAGVYLEGEANNIIISKNIIFNKNNNNKGIYLSSATNTDVAEKYPAFEEFRVENKDVILDLKINGLSDIPDNSRVEVFLANGNKMQSKKYIGNAIKTSKAGITSITIPSHFLDYSGSNYFVATYTNAFNGATSRFSENIEIKNLLCSLNENLLGKGVDKICPGEKIENYIEIPKLELKVTCKEPTDAIAKDVKIEKDSRGQKYIIDKAGEYTLLATVPNNSNCDKRIDFTVIYKSEPAMPNFIVKEYVYVGDTVAVVDLDYEVKNRKMEWVHEGVNQITQKITANNQTEDLDTKKAIYLSYPNTGKATISQVSEKDGCVITVSKEINIIPQPNEKKDKGKVSAEIPTLLDADVYPNPVSGNGNLILTLRTKNKAPFTVTLYRIVDSQPLQNFQYKIDRLIQKTGTIDEFQFEQVIDGWQHLAKGVYYLKVNFNNDIKVIKFITN